jgi:aspartate aminotransferase-like enzyme
MGVFGERFAAIAEAFGLEVTRVQVPFGQVLQGDELIGALESASASGRVYKGVFLTHNETSTGATLDLEAVSAKLNNYRAISGQDFLVVVDSVSGLGGLEVAMDKWDLDVVISGSQKALMTPPGLGLVGIRPRAWAAMEQATLPRFYWDYQSYRKGLDKGNTPYTPAVSLWFALKEALAMIHDEGLENVYRRHQELGAMFRAGVRALGLELLSEEFSASNTITAVVIPENIGAKNLQRALRERFGLSVAGGQKDLSGKIIRVGHMGYTYSINVLTTLAALAQLLAEAGLDIDMDYVLKAARDATT